jgi:hypothetical protein
MKARFDIAFAEASIDLGFTSVHQHETHSERMHQRNVVNEMTEILIDHRLAAEHHDEGTSAMSVDIWCGKTKKIDER